MKRGDVILIRVPHASGVRGKKRPAVVVQSDVYLARTNSVIVAEITKNLTLASDPACLMIDVTTAEGQATGISITSVISCLLLYTITTDTIAQSLGSLSTPMVHQLDACLKAALALP